MCVIKEEQQTIPKISISLPIISKLPTVLKNDISIPKLKMALRISFGLTGPNASRVLDQNVQILYAIDN